MNLLKNVAVIGSAIDIPADGLERSLEERLYDTARRALADAGLDFADIDGIVVAANDQYDGRAIAVMAASGSVGGVGRDILCTPSASEHAFITGVLRVASGQFRTQLVVSWSPTEVSSFAEAQRLAADPYYHRRLPLDDLAADALQASALLAGHPELAELAPRVTAAARSAGARAYPQTVAPAAAEAVAASPAIRWPLRRDMVAPPVAGVVAVVLAGPDFVAAHDDLVPAWVEGMGWATEPSYLGDRDLGQAPALAEAARRAYAEAGVNHPVGDLAVAEVADATPYQKLLVLDTLGLCGPSEWAQAAGDAAIEAANAPTINPSGGVLALNPVFCTGLARIAEAANQVRGRAGRHQVSGATRALAHAASGGAMQYQTVVILNGALRPSAAQEDVRSQA